MRTILLILFLAIFFNLPFSKSQCAGFSGTATVTTAGCNGGCSVITATPINGTAPYTYQLHYNTPIAGAVSDTEQVCASGMYHYAITDANNCTVLTNLVTHNQNTALSILAPSFMCENELANVYAQVVGIGPFSYSWANGDTTPLVVRSPSAMSVTVTDVNGCTIVATDTIQAIPLLDSMYIPQGSLDPFGYGYCENGDSIVLDLALSFGTFISSGTFYGSGVRDGAAGLGIAAFYPDSVVIDMGHVGDTEISYVYQTTTGCWDTTRFTATVHAVPDLSLTNLPDSLCPDRDSFQLLNTNTITFGSIGQFTLIDTLIADGLLTASDENGATIPGFFSIFDTLNPIFATGYEQVNITYTYTSPASFGLCTSTIHDSIIIVDCCVWPGDTDDDGIANNFDLLPIGLHHGGTGHIRNARTIDYTCHTSDDWNASILGLPLVDQKHVDCDGNGLLNSIDTNAIILNWSQTHSRNNSTSSSNLTMYLDTAVTSPGDTLVVDVILSQHLIPSASYGLAFTINYDPLLVDTNSVYATFDNSWLGLINTNMISIQKDFYNQGELEVGLTRIDQTSVTGSGPVAQLHFIIKDDVLPKSLSKRLTLSIDNIRLIDELGVEIPVAGLTSQVLITDAALAADNVNSVSQNKINIAPNPVNQYVRIYSSLEKIQAVNLYNITGQLVQQLSGTGNYTETLNIEKLPAGVYILNVKTEKATKVLRIVKK